MEEHMNFNYIDNNRDNLIEKEEYQFYLEEIGLNPPEESDVPVDSMASLAQTQSPLEVSQKMELYNGLNKTLAQVAGGAILIIATRRMYKKAFN